VIRNKVFATAALVAAATVPFGSAVVLTMPSSPGPVALTYDQRRQSKSGQRRAARRRAERGWL
jgi:hypothetical protein